METSSQTRLYAARSPRLFAALLFTLVALLAVLAACTRDRPAPDVEAAPTPGAAAPAAETPDALPSEIAVTDGEPEVEEAEPVTSTTSTEGVPGELEVVEYEVQPGDTLLSIAIDNGTTTEDLRALNLLSTDLIQVGQRLRVQRIPPTPTPTPEPYYYTVQSGDSLSGIAQAHGVSMVDIMAANFMADANALRAGMLLAIPGYAPAGAVPGDEEGEEGTAAAVDDGSGPAIHIVQPGQTLTQIAQLYGVTSTAIVNANSLANRNQLRSGQQLVIPGVTARQAEEARAIRHTVRSGESLSGIARQYGVAVSDLVRANNLANADSVYVGQVLLVPQPIAE